MYFTASVLAGMVLLMGLLAQAAEPPDFNTHILPIFNRYCTACHNPDEAEGKLVLDTYEKLLAGGSRGPSIAPGKSGQSRLVLLLEGRAKPKMPPEGNEGPKAEEIEQIKAWIDAGAKSPTGAAPDPTKLVTPKIALKAAPRLPINAAAWSPDGSLIALAGYTRVQLISPHSRKLVRELAGHRGNVNDVAFSADGRVLIAAGGEPGLFGEVRLWNVADGSLIRTITGHRDCLYAAAMTRDGRTIATGSYDEQIRLWNVENGQEVRHLAGHNGAIFALAFARNGQLLASASGDRTVKIWDTKTGQRLDTRGESLKDLYALAFHPHGLRLAAGGVDNRIRVWQIGPTAKEGDNPLLYSRFAHDGAIIRLAWSPDGRWLASAAEDRTVKLWSAGQMVQRHLLPSPSDHPTALAFSPDSKSLLVGRLDGTLDLFDVQTGQAQTTALALADAAQPAKAKTKSTPAKPEITAVWPRGVQRGATTRITLTGKHLADVSQLAFNNAKLTGKLMADDAKHSHALVIDVTAADGLALGGYELTLKGPGGAAAPLKLHLDDLEQVVEQEPNLDGAAATSLTLPVSVWGAIGEKGDADLFSFEARGGQTIVLDLGAQSLGSKLNGVLTLTDSQGRVMIATNDFDGQADPLLAFTPPADGRYVVRLSDLMLAGSDEHFYRLSVGTFPYVTGVFPLGVAAQQDSKVELVGYNLPANCQVKLAAAAPGEQVVPLDIPQARQRRPIKVVVGSLPEALEAEPNNDPQRATALSVPATVNGRLHSESSKDVDLFRFQSQAGQKWVIETDAARRGSPIDTRIEVLDGTGQPVERLLLEAVRDSYITFRPIDSQTIDARVKNWEEMELNELLYLQGEVCKIFRMPQGPDSGFNFYGIGGKRRTYFDTSATTHAMDEPCYIVQPHAPGTQLIPNGLPVFPLYYANDDEGDRKLGRDSRLLFTAPVAGEYLVRVGDVRELGGERFAYRLTIREPRPDFSVTLGGANPTISAGSGKGIVFTADRSDGFDGDITIDIANLPPGFSVSSPIVIQAGHLDAKAVVSAAADAPQPTKENASHTNIVARGEINGVTVEKRVNTLGKITLGEKPNLLVFLEPAELTIAPGATITATLRVQRNGFQDRVQFAVENLPHGVIVDNIGLNGVLIPEGQDQRQIFLNAAPWVPPTTRPFHAVANNAGAQASAPVILHVREAPKK